jgi:hypothetical protein
VYFVEPVHAEASVITAMPPRVATNTRHVNLRY